MSTCSVSRRGTADTSGLAVFRGSLPWIFPAYTSSISGLYTAVTASTGSTSFVSMVLLELREGKGTDRGVFVEWCRAIIEAIVEPKRTSTQRRDVLVTSTRRILVGVVTPYIRHRRRLLTTPVSYICVTHDTAPRSRHTSWIHKGLHECVSMV